MGNYCCQAEKCKRDQLLRKKSKSQISTKSNEINQIQDLKNDEYDIIEMLNTKGRFSMRCDCPRITHVQVLSQLGKGAQAEVYQVKVQTQDSKKRYSENKKQQKKLAIKRIHIDQIGKSKHSIELANHLMIQNDCPFIMKGLFVCENEEYMYEGMQLAEGGELTSFLEKTIGKGDAFRKLGQQGIKMVIAGIIIGIQFLHNNGLTYCDLKTDNVLIGIDGYPRLADFQLSTDAKQTSVSNYQGTITYAGPEIFNSQKFNKSLDLWALGVLIYTLAYNQEPFSKQEVIDEKFVCQCKNKEDKYKLNRKKTSKQLCDLINKLLKVDPSQRLGSKDINDIKKHEFFKSFNWDLYSKKKLVNPLAQIVRNYPLKTIKREVNT